MAPAFLNEATRKYFMMQQLLKGEGYSEVVKVFTQSIHNAVSCVENALNVTTLTGVVNIFQSHNP